jgi:hypothetical protein
MACDLETIQDACCESHICRVRDEITLLQLTAQAAANWVENVSPGTDVSVDAVMDRACESGILRVTDELTLMQITAQNLCAVTTT